MKCHLIGNVFWISVALAAALQAAEPQDIPFKADYDGTEQRYVRLDPESLPADHPPDLLIALHGHGSDRWQFISSDRDEARACREFAIRHQMIYISPDYRARTSWMGPAAEADMLQIIKEVKRNSSPRRVFLCGGSMGGSSALTFTALHPDLIHGVVALNPTANHLEYENFQEAISESFGGTKIQIPNEYKSRSPEYFPELFTMPVAITTGGKDTLVPPESARRLAGVLQKINRPALLIHREEGGHSTNLEDATAALDFMLKHAK